MKRKIAIVGGGACALMLASELDPEKFEVSLYEKNSALGRKFLVAGEGGLNLTHSENESAFISRYTPSSFLEEAYKHFSNQDLIKWINALEIKTYVGSSGRIFPEKGIKPIEVLNAILNKIKTNKVSVFTKHNWKGFSENGALLFDANTTLKEIKYDRVIFCLGGASWPVTGSTGDWVSFFQKKNILVNPFKASNSSFTIDWPSSLLNKIEGKLLKNISIGCLNKTHLGEVVLIRSGIEGSGIYPLSPEIREQLATKNSATIRIDFKPNLSTEKILEKLKAKPLKINLTDFLKTGLNLSEGMILLLKHYLSKEEFLNEALLAENIKAFRIQVTDTGPVDEAISTVGGIDLEEITCCYELKKLPGIFCVGEMLDYDAPTGGYLLQSCFSMAKFLADYLNRLNVITK